MTEENDAVIIGSGAAGLTAALSAASLGLRVTLLEKAPVFGGTTAVSGGSVWAPNSKYPEQGSRPDSREDALTYVRALALGRVDDRLIETFVDTINPTLDFLEKETAIEFSSNPHHPDYQPHLRGPGTAGARCRSASTTPISSANAPPSCARDTARFRSPGWRATPGEWNGPNAGTGNSSRSASRAAWWAWAPPWSARCSTPA